MPQSMTAHPNAFLMQLKIRFSPIAVPKAVMGRFRMDANVR
jgi:hypothetical protein